MSNSSIWLIDRSTIPGQRTRDRWQGRSTLYFRKFRPYRSFTIRLFNAISWTRVGGGGGGESTPLQRCILQSQPTGQDTFRMRLTRFAPITWSKTSGSTVFMPHLAWSLVYLQPDQNLMNDLVIVSRSPAPWLWHKKQFSFLWRRYGPVRS